MSQQNIIEEKYRPGVDNEGDPLISCVTVLKATFRLQSEFVYVGKLSQFISLSVTVSLIYSGSNYHSPSRSQYAEMARD